MTRRRTLGLAVLAIFAVPYLVGCAARIVIPRTNEFARAASGRADVRDQTGVRLGGLKPEYREAVRLFRSGDKPEARRRLVRMVGRPGLGSAEIAFLRRQIAICDGGPPAPDSGGDGPLSPLGPMAGRELSPDSTGDRHGNALEAESAGADCGPRALRIVLAALGRKAPLAEISRLAKTNRFGTTLAGLKSAALAEGVAAEAVQMDLAAIRKLDTRAVAWVDGDHYVAVLRSGEDSAVIRDPNLPRDETIPTETLLRRSGGILLTISPVTK